MTSPTRSVPLNQPVSSGLTLGEEGLVMKYDASGELVKASGNQDDADAVIDQAIVDVEQNTRPTRDGEEVGVFLTGTGDTAVVYSDGGETYNKGDPVYLSGTNNGQVNATDDSGSGDDTIVGYYIGPHGHTTKSDGETIPVVLN